MMRINRSLLSVFATLLLGMGTWGCSAVAPPTKPTVRIVTPAEGAQVSTGRDVQIMASAQDPNGISRLELRVDGALSTTLQPPSPQTDYTVLLPWAASSVGDHILCVRAINRNGASTDSAEVKVKATADAGPIAASTIPPEISPTLVNPPPGLPTPVFPTATSTSLPPTLQAATATARPTSAPILANTSLPQIAPGLYVTAIQPDPSQPKSKPAQFAFRVTFLNSTGADVQLPRWRVLIFRPDAKKSMGDPRGIGGTAGPGTSQQVTQPWQIKVMGCEPFYAKPVREDDGGGLTPLLKPDGRELTVTFQVCS